MQGSRRRRLYAVPSDEGDQSRGLRTPLRFAPGAHAAASAPQRRLSGTFGSIERTADRQAAALQDVGIDHRCFDILVAEEFLDGADIVAVGE